MGEVVCNLVVAGNSQCYRNVAGSNENVWSSRLQLIYSRISSSLIMVMGYTSLRSQAAPSTKLSHGRYKLIPMLKKIDILHSAFMLLLPSSHPFTEIEHIILYIQLISQVLTIVHRTNSLVTMEGAFLMILGVMAIVTVEITVMKMDVSDGRWEETHFIHTHM